MNYLEKYGYLPTNIDEKVAAVRENLAKWQNKEVYAKALGMIDLTSLTVTDTPTRIAAMTQKVNKFNSLYPDYPLPASICVYPNFAKTVDITRENPEVHVTVVGGCFPASQSFLDVKVFECVKAVGDGADEVDIVLALNSFLDGRYDDAAKEISEIKKAITSAVKRNVRLRPVQTSSRLLPARPLFQLRPRPHTLCASASPNMFPQRPARWASSLREAFPPPRMRLCITA